MGTTAERIIERRYKAMANGMLSDCETGEILIPAVANASEHLKENQNVIGVWQGSRLSRLFNVDTAEMLSLPGSPSTRAGGGRCLGTVSGLIAVMAGILMLAVMPGINVLLMVVLLLAGTFGCGYVGQNMRWPDEARYFSLTVGGLGLFTLVLCVNQGLGTGNWIHAFALFDLITVLQVSLFMIMAVGHYLRRSDALDEAATGAGLNAVKKAGLACDLTVHPDQAGEVRPA